MTLFEKVAELDCKINDAYESNNIVLADELLQEQDSIVSEIERLGLRDQFDAYILTIQ